MTVDETRSAPGVVEAKARRAQPTTLLLAVLCGVLFLDGLDISLVGVALPSIKADLRLSTSQLQWIVSAYVLGYGGLLLLGGRTADLIGRRRTLLTALGVFAVASILAGATSDGTLLIITRFVKGGAAAFTAPAGLSIITTTFAEGPERNRALAIYSATGASGFSLGLVLGGALTQIGWRWAFIVPGPLTLALLLLAVRAVPRDDVAASARKRFDVGGAVTLTAAMLLLVSSLVEAPDRGWTAAATVGGFAASALLLASFVAIEHRVSAPLVRLGILRSRPLVRANLGALALFGPYVGFQFILTLYLQSMNGWSPIRTALAFLPLGVLIAVGSTRIGRVMHRIGTARLMVLGFCAMAAGYLLLLRIVAAPDYALVLLPTMLLVGTGIGVCFPALNAQATSGVGDHEQGLASGLVQSSLQIGGAVVLAVVSAIVSAKTGAPSDRAALFDAYRTALVVVAGVAVAGLAVALSGITRQRGGQLAESLEA